MQDGADTASADFQTKMEHVSRIYIDTESSQSIALSFKSKERFKRSRSQPGDEIKRAINQAQLEVEMLLVSEVKAFLDSGAAGSAALTTSRSPRMPAVSPRPVTVAMPTAGDGRAETRNDRSQSEAVGPGQVDAFRTPLSPPPATLRSTSSSPGPGGATGGNSPGIGAKIKDSVRSFSVSSNSPSKAAQRAVLKGQGSSGETSIPSSGAGGSGGGGSGIGGSGGGSAAALYRQQSGSVSAMGARQFDVVVESMNVPRTTQDTTAYTWGDNIFGQLGLANQVEASVCTPTPVPIPNVAFVQCTDSYTVLVDANGQAFCSGKLSESATFVPILEGHVVRQVGCGLQFCIALLDTGKLLYYGANRALEKLPISEQVTKIVCGGRHCLALTVSGKVYSWGSDEKKQLGHGLAERVPKPKLLAALSDIVDIAAGKNSSSCVSSAGVVTAWGAVVPRAELTVLEELRNKNIERVSCSDKFVVGISDLGRVFVWHLDAVPDLALHALPNPVVALRSSSVFRVVCADAYIVALTDTGDVVTWGEYGSFLGQGARSSVKRYGEAPRRLQELQCGLVRRLSCSELHVVVASGDGGSKAEQMVWDMFVRERSYCRSLYAVAEEYSRRIKIKDTAIFQQARLLLEHHMVLLREFSRLLDTVPKQSHIDVGSLYAMCFASPDVADIYKTWPTVIAVPLDKLNRPKLAATLADLETEVDLVVKKNDTASDMSKSFALVSLLRDPLNYLSQCLLHLQQLRAVAPEENSASLDKAIAAIAAASGVSVGPSSGMSLNLSSSLTAAARHGGSNVGSIAEGATDEQMQAALRFRALKTELDIFQDANSQLMKYAMALEEELIQKTHALEAGGSAAGSGVGGRAARDLSAFEEEMVEVARENAELKTRLKLMEIYRTQVNGTSDDSSEGGGGGTARPTPNPLLKAKSSVAVMSNPSSPSGSGSFIRKANTPTSAAASPVLRQSTPSTSLRGGSSSSNNNSSDDSDDSVVSAKEHEALRKRINPAAGRLLSEGEGSAARSLEQFTFDSGSTAGVVYSGTELKAATLEKLLEHLTQSSGSLALDTFLISYRNFSTPQDIFRRLVYMYCVAPPAKAKVVWLRLLNFLKSWVVKHFGDWEGETQLRRELFSFLDEIVIPSNPSSTATTTVNTIRERFNKAPQTERQNSQRYLMPAKLAQSAVAPQLLNYKPNVIAEQMTMSEHEIFRAITPSECFNQNWMKKSAGLSPNIIELITRFNKLSRWVAYEVCVLPDPRDRRVMLEKLIAVAQSCREVRAFGMVMAIMGALSSTAVFRLKKTWESLSRASLSAYNELKELVSSEQNFSNLREATKIAELPCFPYIGTFLGDLTFIDSGSQDFSTDGLINWSKFQATANTVLQLQAKQKTPYAFEVLPDWRGFLSNLPDHTEQELFDMSKKVEPQSN